MNTFTSYPLVSVICLCYNHESFLESALNSILRQTYKNIEIIIVDDCSQDNSRVLIKKWIDKNDIGLLIENNQNLGNLKSFNKALKTSKGKYIIDFATDDILLPKFIEKHINNIKSSIYKNPAISFCNVEQIDSNNKHISYSYPIDDKENTISPPPQGYIYKDIVNSYLINSTGIMMSRESLHHLNGYDQSLAYEDLDYLVRASRIFPMIYLDEILVKKRVISTSMTSFLTKKFNQRSSNMRKTTYIICYKIYKLNQTTEEHLALINRIVQEIKLNTENYQITLVVKYCLLATKVLLKTPLKSIIKSIIKSKS